MENAVILLLLAVILIAAGRYVYKAKKSGAKCIGCGVEGQCPSRSGCGCGCGCGGEE